MRSITLAIWDVKRLFRHRAAMAALFGLPLVIALARVALPGRHFTLVSAWACPFACLLMTCGILCVQRMNDKTSGLLDGLKSTPLSHSRLMVSRLVIGFALFALQMAVFRGILAIRF